MHRALWVALWLGGFVWLTRTQEDDPALGYDRMAGDWVTLYQPRA